MMTPDEREALEDEKQDIQLRAANLIASHRDQIAMMEKVIEKRREAISHLEKIYTDAGGVLPKGDMS